MKFFKKKQKHTAKHLSPHTFAPAIELSDKPHIYITPQAYKDMCVLIDMVDTEVGWEGFVERTGNTFLIKEICMMEQFVHETTTILTTEGQSNLGMELFDKRPDEAMDLLNKLRFWGHSHVYMGTSPSPQDDKQMELFATEGVEFFIRGIGNKYGRLEFTLYLYTSGVIVYDVPWSLYDPSVQEVDYKKWEKELSKKVIYQK